MDHISPLMRVFRMFGMEQIAWALRRLYCPVDAQALVLEVGSGGNPYPRANVLLDAYEETRERHWTPLVVDRPFVFGTIERLPFKTQAFDFLIACHVLEHSPVPEKVLYEFQRVARAGYIEVPDAFLERLNPYRDHRLEITVRNNRLRIRKKSGWVIDLEAVELYEYRIKRIMVRNILRRYPFEFYTRYFWQNTITFDILNPEVNAAWPAPEDVRPLPVPIGGTLRKQVREHIVRFLRTRCSQVRRNARLDVFALLQCPTCQSDGLQRSPTQLFCQICGTRYAIRQGIPIMFPQS